MVSSFPGHSPFFHIEITMQSFVGPDYYCIDELYSDEERLVRGTVRDFVNAEVLPVIE